MKQKNNNKQKTCAKQKSNEILLQKINRARSWEENVPKIGVEQIKSNGEFHLYLYLLNI
jgi:hypothetical protein